MSYTLRLADGELERITQQFEPTRDEMDNLAFFLRQQVDDRFRTAGASGDRAWPVRSPITLAAGGKRGRSMMTGRTARLRESWVQFAIDTGEGKWVVGVQSDVPYAHVHQLGTEKYGGPIPTIRPKTAKALFIPITDRAASSERHQGRAAVALHRLYGKPRSGPVRTATRGRKWHRIHAQRVVADEGLLPELMASGAHYSSFFSPLKKGRISKSGELEVQDQKTGKYKRGVPDFIFLQKVDIPPRPMLPDGANEQAEQQKFITSITGGPG